MSKVAVQGHASGTGTLTISAPNTNSDYTLSLPASTGTMLNDQSDITAQVKTATNASGSAPIYSCRAWVNFNGTGTVAIRASGNVSSITDNGTGDYTVNFTTAMPDENYVPTFGGGSYGTTGGPLYNTVVKFTNTTTPGSPSIKTTSALGISSGSTNDNAKRDLAEVYLAIFR